MRALQFLMIFLMAGCLGWASAIFFGPWALTKYLKSEVSDAVEVSGLRVTPKLAVTASRIQMSDGEAGTASLRGVEVDWRLLGGDEPAVLISVANGDFADTISVEDLQIIVTLAENGDPLKISGTAARIWGPTSVSAADVKFEAHTDYRLQLLRRVTATAGDLTTQHATNVNASTSQIGVDQLDVGANLLRQKLSGTLALTNVVVGGPDLSAPDVDIKFASADGLLSLSFGARDLLFQTAGVAVSGLSGSIVYDAARSRASGPVNLGIKDFVWKDIRLPSANAKINHGDERLKVSAEGMSLGSEITLGRRYIGRAPDVSFTAEFDASSLGEKLQISGDLSLAAAQQPVVLDVSFRGAVAGVRQPMKCTEVACEISDVTYDYTLNVAGKTLNGTSSCLEPTCSSGPRTHELSTTDTHKFFANLQGVNLISPLVLGGAYAQMLQGAAVGTGHKINF